MKAIFQKVGIQVFKAEKNRRFSFLHSFENGGSHDIARGQFGHGMVSEHKTLTIFIDQVCAFSPDSFTDKVSILAVYGKGSWMELDKLHVCLLYTSPSPRDGLLSRMP